MISQTKEDLIHYIDDLDCQIEYLKRAVKLDLVNQDEGYRLNALIVKKAFHKKELENIEANTTINIFIKKIKQISGKRKTIEDYFH